MTKMDGLKLMELHIYQWKIDSSEIIMATEILCYTTIHVDAPKLCIFCVP